MRFFCIDDAVPDTTISLLRAACESRDVEFLSIDARRYSFDPSSGLADADMMYRPAVSLAAIRVEQFLAHAGVATFYADCEGPFFSSVAHFLHFQMLGLPTPRSLPLGSTDRDALRAAVDHLGGLPLVLKAPGFEGGAGVMRVDSLASLFSLADFLSAQGAAAFLSAYVGDAEHWRVVVVGERAVAAHLNPLLADDFRSAPSDDPADFTATPDADLANLAVRAVRALRLEFGGVDILRHESGRLYLLEANFPCYFPTAQTVAGIDVAGAMVDHLIAKSRAFRGAA